MTTLKLRDFDELIGQVGRLVTLTDSGVKRDFRIVLPKTTNATCWDFELIEIETGKRYALSSEPTAVIKFAMATGHVRESDFIHAAGVHFSNFFGSWEECSAYVNKYYLELLAVANTCPIGLIERV